MVGQLTERWHWQLTDRFDNSINCQAPTLLLLVFSVINKLIFSLKYRWNCIYLLDKWQYISNLIMDDIYNDLDNYEDLNLVEEVRELLAPNIFYCLISIYFAVYSIVIAIIYFFNVLFIDPCFFYSSRKKIMTWSSNWKSTQLLWANCKK